MICPARGLGRRLERWGAGSRRGGAPHPHPRRGRTARGRARRLPSARPARPVSLRRCRRRYQCRRARSNRWSLARGVLDRL